MTLKQTRLRMIIYLAYSPYGVTNFLIHYIALYVCVYIIYPETLNNRTNNETIFTFTDETTCV